MTVWINIKDYDDLDVDDDKTELHVYVNDYFGANCISIPLELIKKLFGEKEIWIMNLEK